MCRDAHIHTLLDIGKGVNGSMNLCMCVISGASTLPTRREEKRYGGCAWMCVGVWNGDEEERATKGRER